MNKDILQTKAFMWPKNILCLKQNWFISLADTRPKRLCLKLSVSVALIIQFSTLDKFISLVHLHYVLEKNLKCSLIVISSN